MSIRRIHSDDVLVSRAKALLRKHGGPDPDAQAAEIERLQAELAMSKADERWQVVADEVGQKLLAAEAELDALRALVSEAMPVWIEWVRVNPPAYPTPTGFDWLTRARAALGGQP